MRPLESSLVFLLVLPGTIAAEEPEGTRVKLEKLVQLPAHERLLDKRLESGSVLADFTTDGCSGGMSAGWKLVSGKFPEFAQLHNEIPPWESCCVVHDRAYHLGGVDPEPEVNFQARLEADKALQFCVSGWSDNREDALAEQYDLAPEQVETAYGLLAEGMFLSVRAGGAPCSGLSWRWGYGWPDCGWLSQ